MEADLFKHLISVDEKLNQTDTEMQRCQALTLDRDEVQKLVISVKNVAEDLKLTKEKMRSDEEDYMSQYLQSTEEVRTELNNAWNSRFINLETSIKRAIIQEKTTDLVNYQDNMITLMGSFESRIQDMTANLVNELKQTKEQVKALEIQVISMSNTNTDLKQNMIDMGLAYQELKEQAAIKMGEKLGEQSAISDAPTGMTTLTNSSSTLYLTSGAIKRAEMTGGNVSSPPAIHNMIGQLSKPHQGEYMFTRLKSVKNGQLPIIESSSANAPDMTEMYNNMLPGSSDDSFSDSDYHSSDGNSFMDRYP